MKIKFGISILLITVLAGNSCKDTNGFEKHEKGFEYKMINLVEDGDQILENDYISLTVMYFTGNDSLLFDTKEIQDDFRMRVMNAEQAGLLQEAVKMMKVGDSAHFLIPADDFYKKTAGIEIPEFITESENLRFEIKLDKKFSEDELKKEYEQHMLQAEAMEKQLLSEYLSVENITEEPSETGLYIISLEKGKGKKAKKGKIAVVHYKGMLINGQVFDTSIDKGEPLEFVLGQKEVILAWDEAVATMRVEDKIKIIAPSYLAYGEQGYPPVIPAFSTLIFEIKLIDVK